MFNRTLPLSGLAIRERLMDFMRSFSYDCNQALAAHTYQILGENGNPGDSWIVEFHILLNRVSDTLIQLPGLDAQRLWCQLIPRYRFLPRWHVLRSGKYG